MKPRDGYHIDSPPGWETVIGLALMLALMLGAAAVILEIGGIAK